MIRQQPARRHGAKPSRGGVAPLEDETTFLTLLPRQTHNIDRAMEGDS